MNQSIQPLTNDMLGAMARVVEPTFSPYVAHGRVMEVDVFSDLLYIEDPTGDFYTLLDEGGVLTIFDNHDATINNGEVHTAGVWDAMPSFDPNTGLTTFTAAGGANVFPTHGIGWTLQPDARHSVFFQIESITSSEIKVRGDAESQMLYTPGSEDGPVWYFIIPPVGVDKEDGALDLGTHAYPSLYLAFHYRYIKPLAGVSVTTTENPYLSQDGIYGAQSPEFINRQGQYQAWHRYYNPVTGRWTTPDPAAMPWTNLLTYVGENPVSRSDPSGLQSGPTPEIPVPTPGESDPVRDTLDRIADVCVDIILLPFRAIAWFFGWLFGGSGDLSDAERLARCIEKCEGHHKHRMGVCNRQPGRRFNYNREYCIEDSEMRYERCIERCER